MSPALVGRFISTVPPGKSILNIFLFLHTYYPVFRIHLFIFNLKERPRSAVEQLCLAESTRPRMTVEEQMERIRRHQQACLREKKKTVADQLADSC